MCGGGNKVQFSDFFFSLLCVRKNSEGKICQRKKKVLKTKAFVRAFFLPSQNDHFLAEISHFRHSRNSIRQTKQKKP